MPEHCEILKHNIDELKLSNVEVYCDDYTKIYHELKQERFALQLLTVLELKIIFE